MTVIDVTQEDINRGLRGRPDGCPIARAMNRTLGEGWLVQGPYAVSFIAGRFCVMPDSVEAFVNAFDEREPVQPFQFTVPI